MDRPFRWNSVPTEIQLSILSLLPVSTLIVCTSISPSLRSTIQSRPFTSSYKQKSGEAIFLFSDFPPTSTFVAYNSSSDSWSSLPVPANLVSFQFSHGTSILARALHDRVTDALLIFNPLRPNLNPKPIPPAPKVYRPFAFFTLPDSPPSHLKIVAVKITEVP